MLTKKQQQKRKQEKQKEAAALAKLAKSLGRQPNGVLPKIKRKKNADDGSSLSLEYRANDTQHIPSAKGVLSKVDGIFLVEGEDWVERERIASEEIEKKKKRIAPHFSKGPYQYLTDDTDPTTVGRKI